MQLYNFLIALAQSAPLQILEALLISAEATLVVFAFAGLRARQGWTVQVVDPQGSLLGTYKLAWTEAAKCYVQSLTGLQLLKSCASTHGMCHGLPGGKEGWLEVIKEVRTLRVKVTPRSPRPPSKS